MTEIGGLYSNTAIQVTCGRICLHCKKINLSSVFAGQTVGFKEVEGFGW